jgi:hypothetical protein
VPALLVFVFALPLFQADIAPQLQMAQPGLFFGQPDARILSNNSNTTLPLKPPSFADFKFNTIGQQPQLLKRISAAEPDHHYIDHSSPEPSIDRDHSVQSTSKALSRPSLLQTLTAQAERDATMTDASDDMVVDTHSVQLNESLLFSKSSVPRGLSHFSTTRLDPGRPPLGWSGNTPPVNQPSSNLGEGNPYSKSPVSQGQPQEATTLNPPQPLQKSAETSSHSSTPSIQPMDVNIPSVQTQLSSPTQVIPSPIRQNVATVCSASPIDDEGHSSYTALRALQSRLLSSLSSFKPPQIDTSHALLLVQAANSHSANALSTAHRVNILAQQAFIAARDAATVAQECLIAAEQAKAHVSVAVSAVEQIGNPDPGGLKNEWEWKTVIADLRDGVCALGQWVGEREGEEAALRRERERAEKERKHKESVESAMRISDGLPPQLARVMSVEASQKTTSAKNYAESSGTNVGAHIDLRASAEMEADAARRAWSLEHRSPPKKANADLSSAWCRRTAQDWGDEKAHPCP